MFTWLRNLISSSPRVKGDYTELLANPHWEVLPPKDYVCFFQQLTKYTPTGSLLYIEGTSFSKEVEAFLKSKHMQSTQKFSADTIWPRPRVYHLNIDDVTLKTLSALAENFAAPELCDHLRVYFDDTKLLLSWHDFPYDPFMVADTMSKDQISNFCRDLNTSYKEVPNGL